MNKSFYEVVNEKLGPSVFKDASVLDVGCMRFAQSVAMRDMGARVIATDICKREEPPEGITFIESDFLKLEPKEPVDILYMSNSALFMPTEDVFKKIAAFNPKTIAIRTMYDYPEPNWDATELKPLYFTSPSDWETFFKPLGYETKHIDKYENENPDFRGRMRKFRFTEYIARKAE